MEVFDDSLPLGSLTFTILAIHFLLVPSKAKKVAAEVQCIDCILLYIAKIVAFHDRDRVTIFRPFRSPCAFS